MDRGFFSCALTTKSIKAQAISARFDLGGRNIGFPLGRW